MRTQKMAIPFVFMAPVVLACLFPGQAALAHGRLSDPPSRIILCAEGKNTQCPAEAWQANAQEGGKFFPLLTGGHKDPAAVDDVMNEAPPADGKIAGVMSGGGDLPFLNEQSAERWKKADLVGGDTQVFTWELTALHKTRRWNYFITRDGWNANAPLTRAQFDAQPFCSTTLQGNPYWDPKYDLMPKPTTRHTCSLPKKTGYHVILAVWEVADTPRGFYQVLDADFTAAAPAS